MLVLLCVSILGVSSWHPYTASTHVYTNAPTIIICIVVVNTIILAVATTDEEVVSFEEYMADAAHPDGNVFTFPSAELGTATRIFQDHPEVILPSIPTYACTCAIHIALLVLLPLGRSFCDLASCCVLICVVWFAGTVLLLDVDAYDGL
jgi:hypothetical protein